ncbi:MAG: DUF896 domain-containing protein [Clostridia bacterium]|nr:DUF896 domain-containing protein [Clostridia bacterium]
MDRRSLERINELAVKSKTDGLTTDEKAEQEALRFQYISELRENLRAQLDETVIKYPDGRTERLSDKKKK